MVFVVSLVLLDITFPSVRKCTNMSRSPLTVKFYASCGSHRNMIFKSSGICCELIHKRLAFTSFHILSSR